MSENVSAEPTPPEPVAESIPPVETAEGESGPPVESEPGPASGPAVMSADLREKTVDKVDEICESLARICGTGGAQEIEASRYFSQPLQGELSGYTVIVDVRVSLRKLL